MNTCCQWLDTNYHPNKDLSTNPTPYCGGKIFKRSYCENHYYQVYDRDSKKNLRQEIAEMIDILEAEGYSASEVKSMRKEFLGEK